MIRNYGIALLGSIAGHLCLLLIVLIVRVFFVAGSGGAAGNSSAFPSLVNTVGTIVIVTFPLALLATGFLIWKLGRPLRPLSSFLGAGAGLGVLFPVFYILVLLLIQVVTGDVGALDMVFRIAGFALILFGVPCAAAGMAAAATTRWALQRWGTRKPETEST